jgi:hypothetical protein
MRGAQLLAIAAVAAAATTACDRRPVYEPPAASFTVEALDVADGGGARPSQRVRGAAVTPAFFSGDSLAVRPLLGRLFRPADYQADSGGVVILGQRLWEERFGARPQVIGTWIRVDGRPATVVGVMPRHFDVPAGTDAWVPTAGTGSAAAPTREFR